MGCVGLSVVRVLALFHGTHPERAEGLASLLSIYAFTFTQLRLL